MRVSNASSNALRRAGCCHILNEVSNTTGRRRLLTILWPSSCSELYQLGPQPLVYDEVDCCLNDAIVRRRQAAIEAKNTVLLIHTTDAL